MFKPLKKILLPLAILAAIIGGASAHATTLPQTRVGGYQLFDTPSRPAEAAQVPQSQQPRAVFSYDTAPECSVAAEREVSAATTVGRRGQEVSFPNPNAPVPRNTPGSVGGRDYSGHAFDRMQERGFTPTVIENAIQTGVRSEGATAGTLQYFNSVNKFNVIIDKASGKVVTVF